MNRIEILHIVSQIEFRNWEFFVGGLGDGWFVQVRFEAPDNDTGAPSIQHGRKFYISPYAIEDEVIKTCWLAVELALRHEAMEQFLYCGGAPFHPHNDAAALAHEPPNRVFRNKGAQA